MSDERSAQVRQVFDAVAATYDDVGVPWFQPIADALVDAVAPALGESVLDVGCGKGAATFPLAQRVGPSGRVVGVDLSPKMLQRGEALAFQCDVDNVEWRVGDAMDLQLPGASFDAVTASLVLFFVPEPATALAEWRRVLRPCGRVGIATFGPPPPMVDELDALFRPYLPPQMLDARTSGQAGPFGSDGALAALFTSCGFTAITSTHVSVALELRGAEEWQRWSQSHGQWAMWRMVPEAERRALVERAAQILAPHTDADGVLRSSGDVRISLARVTP